MPRTHLKKCAPAPPRFVPTHIIFCAHIVPTHSHIPCAHLGCGQTFQNATIHAMQQAPTEAEFRAQLAKLREESPMAADYFDTQVDHDQVYQYKFNENGVATHGHTSSNISESTNAFMRDARHETPYRANDEVAKWIGKEFADRADTMTKWIAEGHQLTPYTHNLFATQVGLVPTLCPTFVVTCAQWAHVVPTCAHART